MWAWWIIREYLQYGRVPGVQANIEGRASVWVLASVWSGAFPPPQGNTKNHRQNYNVDSRNECLDNCTSTMAGYDSDDSLHDQVDYTETGVLLGYASKEPTEDEISRLGGHPV